ncbi:MAG TPA: DUF4339 domain-containing protein [Candidatus Angelobacter sp.]
MKYYIKRELNEYGPYTLADVQRYVGQGNILMTDLARSEGLTDWVPVSQVLGNIPVPVPASAMPGTVGTVYSGTPGFGVATTPAMSTGPVPPDFHWALVLLINFFCGLFSTVWLFVEAGFIRKIRPESKGVLFMILSIAGLFVGEIMVVVGGNFNQESLAVLAIVGLLLLLAGVVLYFVAVFTMRSDMEDYYNSVENINLQLSGVMTFFFAVFYFQHHFTRIAQWKKTGILQPQG